MKISVELPSIKNVKINLPENTSGKIIKKKVCENFNIEPELTKLLLNGRIIEDHEILSKELLSSNLIIFFSSMLYPFIGEIRETT